MFHLLGGKAAGLVPMMAREANGDTHWWLRDGDGRVIDPTREQYTSLGEKPPYAIGKGCGFLTKAPSKRAERLLRFAIDRKGQKSVLDLVVRAQAFVKIGDQI